MFSDQQSSSPSTLSFQAFCDAVEVRPSLPESQLVKTCTYIEKEKRFAPHRCLLIDVCLGNEGHSWLRLDRRPTSRLALLGGLTLSNDQVMVARTVKELELEKYELENAQVFTESPPTLRDLIQVLRAFLSAASKYKLWSENACFLCSAVEELLSQAQDGKSLYIAGHHQSSQLTKRSQKRISGSIASQRRSEAGSTKDVNPLAFLLAPPPPPPSRFTVIKESNCTHQSFVERCAINIALYLRDYDTLNQSEVQTLKAECVRMLRQSQWDGGSEYANDILAQHLYQYGRALWLSDRHQAAIEAAGQSVNMTRILHRRVPDLYLEDLPTRLRLLGDCHGFAEVYGSACTFQAEAITLYRQLQERNPDKHTSTLAQCLDDYTISLREYGSHQEAQDAKAESVALTRKLHQEHPDAYATNLAVRLYDYGTSLQEYERFQEAREVAAESVAITRELYKQHPEMPTTKLAERLWSYSNSLQKCGSPKDACDARAESVTITRELHQQDPKIHTSKLAERLNNYGLSLHELGLYQEACDAEAESVALTRKLHQENPDTYAPDLAKRLHDYGVALRERGLQQKGRHSMHEFGDRPHQLPHPRNQDRFSSLLEEHSSHLEHFEELRGFRSPRMSPSPRVARLSVPALTLE